MRGTCALPGQWQARRPSRYSAGSCRLAISRARRSAASACAALLPRSCWALCASQAAARHMARAALLRWCCPARPSSSAAPPSYSSRLGTTVRGAPTLLALACNAVNDHCQGRASLATPKTWLQNNMGRKCTCNVRYMQKEQSNCQNLMHPLRIIMAYKATDLQHCQCQGHMYVPAIWLSTLR